VRSMTWTNLATNLMFAWLLLLINGRIGKWKERPSNVFSYSAFGFRDITEDNFSDNFFQVLIHPAIYLAIISSILQVLSVKSIVYKLCLVVPFYWGLRFVVAAFRDTACFLNWRFQFVLFLVSLLLSEGTLFFIIRPLIDQKKSIFIDLEQFRDSFWFAVFCVIAKFIWDYSKHMMLGKQVFPSSKKATVIIRRYEKYYRKYNEVIQSTIDRECEFKSHKEKNHFSCLVYAVMIYEAHNRPFVIRVMEYIVKFFCPNRLMSLGIMQFQSERSISNSTSVLLAVRKLYKAFSTARRTIAIEEAIYDYNPNSDYVDEVRAIYSDLVDHMGLTEYGRQIVKVKKRSYVYK